ncbi:histone-lysine N-methyltransferase SETMAR [Trichonephila clavipes]|nr:histone-lysine N-methyltransferase SETMAR [Trichonephila clavipes]
MTSLRGALSPTYQTTPTGAPLAITDKTSINPSNWQVFSGTKARTQNLLATCPWPLLLGEDASQVAEIANGVYGTNIATAKYVQFWFHRFRSGISDVKDTARKCRSVIENVDKIIEIIEVDRHVSSRSITQERHRP